MRRFSQVFKKADVSTAVGRGQERYRRVLLYFFSSALPRSVGFLTPLITIPLTLNYLGAERFGLWMIIVSFLALLSFADLGMANGLVNALVEANGKNNQNLACRYLSSALFMLAAIAVVWALVFALVYPWLSWENLFGISDPVAIAEAGPALAVFMGCFLFNLPLAVLFRAQFSYQEGHIYNLWEALGKLLGFGAVVFVVFQEMGLPWLVLAFTGVPLIATLANGVYFFRRKYSWLMPRWKYMEIAIIKQLFSTGLLFFVYQFALSVGLSSDNIILAQVLGSEAVTIYLIPLRLFEIITVLVMMFSSALWPAYREAIARKEFLWVKTTLLKATLLTLALTTSLSCLLIIWGNTILKVWVGPAMDVDLFIWIGLGVFTALTALGHVFAMFLYSANAIRFQAVIMGLFAIAAIVMKILMAQEWGIIGLILGNILAYTIFAVIPMIVVVLRIIKRLLADEAQYTA